MLETAPADGDVSAHRVEPRDPAAQRLLARRGFARVPNTGDDRWVGPRLSADGADPAQAEPFELVTAALLDDPEQLEQLRRIAGIADEESGADRSTTDRVRTDHEIRLAGGGFAQAARRGFARVVTDVRPDNAAMIAVLRHLRHLGYEQEDRPSYVRRAPSSGR